MKSITELTNPNFRYTFQPRTITNMDLPEGLYKAEFRGEDVVLQVDKFGEVRIANETPCNNEDRLAQTLRKVSFVEQVNAKYTIKTAKIGVVQFDLTCPDCGGSIPSPGGSLNWDAHEQVPDRGYCNECGVDLKIPTAKVKKLLRTQ